MSDGPFKNTDRELWREVPDDSYSPSIHVTAGGGIGIKVGGTVIVRPAREWHRLANDSLAQYGPSRRDALDNLAAAMENVLLHFGEKMAKADCVGRWALVHEARAVLARDDQAVADERERCAQIAESIPSDTGTGQASLIAAAIRNQPARSPYGA